MLRPVILLASLGFGSASDCTPGVSTNIEICLQGFGDSKVVGDAVVPQWNCTDSDNLTPNTIVPLRLILANNFYTLGPGGKDDFQYNVKAVMIQDSQIGVTFSEGLTTDGIENVVFQPNDLFNKDAMSFEVRDQSVSFRFLQADIKLAENRKDEVVAVIYVRATKPPEAVEDDFGNMVVPAVEVKARGLPAATDTYVVASDPKCGSTPPQAGAQALTTASFAPLVPPSPPPPRSPVSPSEEGEEGDEGEGNGGYDDDLDEDSGGDDDDDVASLPTDSPTDSPS